MNYKDMVDKLRPYITTCHHSLSSPRPFLEKWFSYFFFLHVKSLKQGFMLKLLPLFDLIFEVLCSQVMTLFTVVIHTVLKESW